MNFLRVLVATFVFAFAGLAIADEPLNINAANAETLAEAIKGVGMKRAEAIVAYRQEHGPFKNVDALIQVRGIGQSIVDGSRDRLTVVE
ncbi:MAG: competence protein ComEA [Gammaproteobacteria bacterium]|nr:MAG: competence protein ComEA [Gammaproteobacteria bacterium]